MTFTAVLETGALMATMGTQFTEAACAATAKLQKILQSRHMTMFILAPFARICAKNHLEGKWRTEIYKAVIVPVVAGAAALVAEAAAGPGPAAVPAVHAAVPAAPAGEDPSHCWPAAASGTSPRERLERLHEI